MVDIDSEEFGRAKGSGMTTDSVNSSYIRAVVELGENIIFKTKRLEDRGGLSGGFLFSEAIQRGKYELIERDSFLYHYRERAPFLSRRASQEGDALLFEMKSKVPGVHCFFATTRECANGQNPCLLLGLGAHKDPSQAQRKALGELSTMQLDHDLRPGWCEALAASPEKISRLPDYHHVQSRDSRNIEAIKEICSVSGESLGKQAGYDSEIQRQWRVEKMESPIRFAKYCHISNSRLEALKFGFPEEKSLWRSESPLYHPIW